MNLLEFGEDDREFRDELVRKSARDYQTVVDRRLDRLTRDEALTTFLVVSFLFTPEPEEGANDKFKDNVNLWRNYASTQYELETKQPYPRNSLGRWRNLGRMVIACIDTQREKLPNAGDEELAVAFLRRDSRIKFTPLSNTHGFKVKI
jgi:hypothetical protein